MKKKVSQKFLRMAEVYKVFARDWSYMLDFSDAASYEMYVYESQGKGTPSESNGYFQGKKWLNVTVAMWKSDIATGILFKQELYADPAFPHWWLDSILN